MSGSIKILMVMAFLAKVSRETQPQSFKITCEKLNLKTIITDMSADILLLEIYCSHESSLKSYRIESRRGFLEKVLGRLGDTINNNHAVNNDFLFYIRVDCFNKFWTLFPRRPVLFLSKFGFLLTKTTIAMFGLVRFTSTSLHFMPWFKHQLTN
jgi:hypothetical protein